MWLRLVSGMLTLLLSEFYMYKYILCPLLVIFAAVCGCNSDDEWEDDINNDITIGFPDGESVFSVAVGESFQLTPEVFGAENPVFQWVNDDGRIVSSGLTLKFTPSAIGEYYLTLKVMASNGNASADIRVDAVEAALPVVSLPEEISGVVGKVLKVIPSVANASGAVFEWSIDGSKVSDSEILEFTPDKAGEFVLKLKVSNAFGSSEASSRLIVSDSGNVRVTFDKESFTMFKDRRLDIRAFVSGTEAPAEFQWFVNGQEVQSGSSDNYVFEPRFVGEYEISVVVTSGSEKAKGTVKVSVLNVNEGDRMRPSTGSSSMSGVKIYDYTPAPGQFVNLVKGTTAEEACRLAEKEIEAGRLVSLGAFGGYIVAGFDHSVAPSGNDYDFAIAGNSFDTSNEPGIVWVMQDENGNGLPDDTWYELKGSEYEDPYTVFGYMVTYFRPASEGAKVTWIDNFGHTGTINREPYWPTWISGDSYVLRGTLLASKTKVDGGQFVNPPFGWGYVDNRGSDIAPGGGNVSAGEPVFNRFRIADAVTASGLPANLKYVDFIKVQSAVQANSGPLGEVSTEVLGFKDLQ